MKMRQIIFALLLSLAGHANAGTERFIYQKSTSTNMTLQGIYQLGSKKDDPTAMYAPGSVYMQGVGVEQDYEQAFNWLFRAADRGNSDAMNYLGVAYATGAGVPQNNALALRWFLKAADKGSIEAMSNAAIAYCYGLGGPVNYTEAAKWFGRAAARGDAAAMNSLAIIFERGMGVPQKHNAAAALLTRSAKLGYPLAMENLGVLYANGGSVKRDNLVAYAWLGAALEAGLQGEDRDVAMEGLDVLAEELGAADLARARKLVGEFTAATIQHPRSRKTPSDSTALKPSFL
jgi:TPR repeat protein